MTQVTTSEGLEHANDASFALVRSGGWAIAEYVAYPLIMLAAMPLFLWALGTIQFGQWMLVLTITGLGSLGSLGMGPAATRLVAAAQGRGELTAAGEGARACLAIASAGAALLSLLVLAVGFTVGDKIFSKVGTLDEISVVFAFAAALLFVEQVDAIFAGILKGLERFDLAARLEIMSKVLQVLGCAAIAWQARTVFAVFVATLVFAVLRAAAKMMAARKLLGWVPLWPKWSPAELRAAFGFGKWVWAQSVGQILFAAADRALVAAMLGADALARYALAIQLAQQVQTIPAAGAQVLFPAVTKRLETGQNWGPVAVKASLAIAAMGLAGTVALLLFGNWFVTLWLGSQMARQIAQVLPWLVLGFGLLSFSAGAHFVLMGTGRARLIALVTVLSGVVATVLIPIGITRWGLAGATIGRIAYAFLSLGVVVAMVRVSRASPIIGAASAEIR